MTNDLKRCFDILDVAPDSSYEEAKAAYRLMAQVWHPDKHSHNDKLQDKAITKFKELNNAWSDIEAYFKDCATRELTERQAHEKAQREAQEKRQRYEEAKAAIRRRREEETAGNDKIGRQNNIKPELMVSCPYCNAQNTMPDSIYSDDRCNACSNYINSIESITYIDKNTGLMWSRNGNIAGKNMSWTKAAAWIKELNYAGFNDWRLPTKNELESFINYWGHPNPDTLLNDNGFSNVKPSWYWTSTIGSKTGYAWLVSLAHINSSTSYKKELAYNVLPVRSVLAKANQKNSSWFGKIFGT